MPSLQTLSSFWSAPVVATNMLVFFNLLGLLVGYERAYHGRAAGSGPTAWSAWHRRRSPSLAAIRRIGSAATIR